MLGKKRYVTSGHCTMYFNQCNKTKSFFPPRCLQIHVQILVNERVKLQEGLLRGFNFSRFILDTISNGAKKSLTL